MFFQKSVLSPPSRLQKLYCPSFVAQLRMATSSSSAPATDQKLDLIKQIKTREVAIAELNHLSLSRAVYQKNGNLYFRTTVQKATAAVQKQLDLEKVKLQKLENR